MPRWQPTTFHDNTGTSSSVCHCGGITEHSQCYDSYRFRFLHYSSVSWIFGQEWNSLSVKPVENDLVEGALTSSIDQPSLVHPLGSVSVSFMALFQFRFKVCLCTRWNVEPHVGNGGKSHRKHKTIDHCQLFYSGDWAVKQVPVSIKTQPQESIEIKRKIKRRSGQ